MLAMRSLLLPLAMIISAALAARELRGGAPGLSAAPRIVFAEKVFDAGVVAHGAVVTHRFRFANEGRAPLEVASVRPSCLCTAAEPTKKRLLPGETAELEVSFDSAKKGVPGGRHRFDNAVLVTTNDRAERDGGSGVSRLSLKAEVVARYVLIPDAGLYFPPAVAGGPGGVTATVEVLPRAGAIPGEPPVPDLAPEGGARVLGAPAGVRVDEVRPVVRDGRAGVRLVCTLLPDAPAGQLAGQIALATGNPRQPRLGIPVQGFVQPAVSADPARLFIARDSANAARSVRLQASRPTRVLAGLVVPAGGGEAPLEATVLEGGRELRVAVRGGAGGAAAGAGGAGDVLLFLDDAAHPVLSVPYVLRDVLAQQADAAAWRAAGVQIRPGELYLGDLDPLGPPREMPVVVLRFGPRSFDIQDIRSDPPGALAARLEPLTPGQIAKIHVRPGPAAASGALLARVLFRPRPGEPEVGFGVVGRVLSPIAAAPAAIVHSSGAPAAVVLRRRDGQALRVLGARARGGRYEVGTEALPDGGVRVTAAGAGARGAETSALIEIDVDVPGLRLVTIPLIDRRAGS